MAAVSFGSALRQGGAVFTSTNYGNTWAVSNTTSDSAWFAITSSSSGQYLATVQNRGYIYTSNDYGLTWIKTNAPYQTWRSIASDGSGRFLAAACLFL